MSREQDILDAAIKIFSEKGFSAATTSEIAKEAGVAEGTIFRYFKTKKDILQSVMVKLIEVMSEELVIRQVGKIFNENKDKEPAVLLKILLTNRLEMLTRYHDLVKIVFTEIQYHEDLRKIFIQSFAVRGKEVMGEFYKENVKKGIFKDYDSSLVLRSFIGMVAMFVIQREIAPDLVQMDDEKQIDMMVDMILYGISKNGGIKNV